MTNYFNKKGFSREKITTGESSLVGYDAIGIFESVCYLFAMGTMELP